jgi:adenylate cyclase
MLMAMFYFSVDPIHCIENRKTSLVTSPRIFVVFLFGAFLSASFMEQRRQLAAILFTDIVGSTTIMRRDEASAIIIAKKYAEVLRLSIQSHRGNILNDYGDGSLCTFNSTSEALHCAEEMQLKFRQGTIVPLRIGLHVGEIFFEDGKVFGDGVNVASRIQSLGSANTILFSKEVFDKIRNQPEFKTVSLGWFEFKNIDEPIEVYALANSGLVVPEKKDLTGKLKEPSKKTGWKKKIVFSMLAMILVLASFFIFHRLKGKSGYYGTGKSVVVLPFENYTKDPGQETLINGITEEIITQLAKISELKVIGKTSSVLYKKSKKPLDQIGEILGVAAYLEGSVYEVGNRVRIRTRLIDAETQENIWANDYDRDLNDIFSMQSEVAEDIAKQLHVKLTHDQQNMINKSATDNIEAYKFYRKGRYFWDKRTKESFDSAEDYYDRAIALDPDYALAYSGKADLYIYNQKGLTQLEAIPIAKVYINKALSLDSTLSEAMTTLGFIQSNFDYDWAQAKSTLLKALSINMNYPTAHLFYGNVLQYSGENTQQGIREIKKALSLDPLSTNLNYVLGRNFYYAREYDSAYEQLRKTLALDAKFSLARGNLVYVLLALKRYPEAFALIDQLDTNASSKTRYIPGTVRAYAHAVTGNTSLAHSELAKSLKETPDQSTFFLAQMEVVFGNYNLAMDKLEEGFKSHDIWMWIMKLDPSFDPIRNEPRFKELMRKMGLD